jgi:hypothetical protein
VAVEQGDLLIKLNQPYGPLAKTLMEKQDFPSDVEVPPYDDVSWTFGLIYGVDVVEIDDIDVLEHRTESYEDGDQFLPKQRLPSGGNVWAIANNGQRELGSARFALGDTPVWIAEENFEARGSDFPAGSLVIDLSDADRDEIEAVLADTQLTVTNIRSMPDVKMHEADLPRIGVYQSWTSTQNAGWVRYSLDEANIPYTLFSKDRARLGDFLEEFDVILIPHMRGGTSLGQIIGGVDPKWSPLPYTNTPDTPSHGHILSSEDITGGMGFEGMAAFDGFIRGGGTLVTFGSAGVLASDSGIVRGIIKRDAGSMNTPGSIMTAKVTDSSSPLVYGYGELSHVMRGNAPIFSVADYDRKYSPLQFGTKPFEDEPEDSAADERDDKKSPPLVISGGIVKGESIIDVQPALISKPVGDGHVVMFNWNPMHRHVNLHDHGFVYNAILSWNDL